MPATAGGLSTRSAISSVSSTSSASTITVPLDKRSTECALPWSPAGKVVRPSRRGARDRRGRRSRRPGPSRIRRRACRRDSRGRYEHRRLRRCPVPLPIRCRVPSSAPVRQRPGRARVSRLDDAEVPCWPPPLLSEKGTASRARTRPSVRCTRSSSWTPPAPVARNPRGCGALGSVTSHRSTPRRPGPAHAWRPTASRSPWKNGVLTLRTRSTSADVPGCSAALPSTVGWVGSRRSTILRRCPGSRAAGRCPGPTAHVGKAVMQPDVGVQAATAKRILGDLFEPHGRLPRHRARSGSWAVRRSRRRVGGERYRERVRLPDPSAANAAGAAVGGPVSTRPQAPLATRRVSRSIQPAPDPISTTAFLLLGARWRVSRDYGPDAPRSPEMGGLRTVLLCYHAISPTTLGEAYGRRRGLASAARLTPFRPRVAGGGSVHGACRQR